MRKANCIQPKSDLKQPHLVVDKVTMEMPMEEYAKWHESIVKDQADFMESTVLKLSESHRHIYMNGYFVSNDDGTDQMIKKHFGKDFMTQCHRPLTLAFVFGSKKILAAILENGADPLVTESNGDTILHSVTSVANSYPDTESDLAATYTYFMSLLSLKQQKELLYKENTLGLRPLEDAAQKGCALLLKSIFQTPGVYLIKERISGMLLHQWYDVTDYESFSSSSRRGKSPLGFLAFMTEKTLEKDGVQDLLYWKPFEHWFRIKLFSNMLWLLLWATYRFAVCLLMMVVIVDEGNIRGQGGVPENQASLYPNATFYYCEGYTTVSFGPQGLIYAAIFACICGLLGMVFDMGEFLYVLISRRPRFLHIQLKRGNVAASFWFYRIAQFLFSLSLVLLSSRIAQNQQATVDTVSDIGRLFFVIMAFASLLFFFEQIPQVGFYIIAIKRMLKDLLYFSVLYVICVSPFVLYFMVFININSSQGCVEHFYNYSTSFYSMFLVMLNMLDFNQFDMRNATVLYFSHIIFIFMVSILLVNFLIAVMSASAARISDRKQILIRLEKLHAMFMMDSRIGCILKKYYTYIINKLALVHDGRIYVVNIEKM